MSETISEGVLEGTACAAMIGVIWGFLYFVAAFGAWDLHPGHWNHVLRGVVAFMGFVLSVAAFCDMRAKM